MALARERNSRAKHLIRKTISSSPCVSHEGLSIDEGLWLSTLEVGERYNKKAPLTYYI